MNIHFICRGNVFRSLVAETYLRSLYLDGIIASSSGTNVNTDDPKEREYFGNTLKLLKKHGIDALAKDGSDRLTQDRLEGCDLVVCMNQRVVDEAAHIVTLPAAVESWDVTDIGEGARTNESERERYEEEIYQEIVEKVDSLIKNKLSLLAD